MEYIKQPELKYLRALGCAYLRITARPSGLSDLRLWRVGVLVGFRVEGFRGSGFRVKGLEFGGLGVSGFRV